MARPWAMGQDTRKITQQISHKLELGDIEHEQTRADYL